MELERRASECKRVETIVVAVNYRRIKPDINKGLCLDGFQLGFLIRAML